MAAAFLALFAGGLPVRAAAAPDQQAPSWSEVKCARYTEAWNSALIQFGRQDLSRDFLERHAAFLASGCRAGRDVCPRSQAELDLANAMSIAAMNAGAASSFLPFACRR
ncbi:hypothetical protein QMO56_21200 [Roseomonas sp. E05]|uniref:hypothetical protein n=1 Tax=Roseomonas sp. E05 TaxID=3046310 RepID=UPI0024B8F8EF|nr:hypothetical protein [Roseomonas sp. E05]MDJ0390635.1 hypothetical protein [Roseomonas sp. E05]